jgi:hypothetical protein
LAVIGGLAFAMLLSTVLTGGLYLLGTHQLPAVDESPDTPTPLHHAG